MAKPYPNLMQPSEGYVFIVTYGRSGSTLTQSYLNSFDDVCVRGENENVLFHLFDTARRIRKSHNYKLRWRLTRKPDRTQTHKLDKLIGTPEDPWYGAEKLRLAAFSKSLCDTFVREALHLPPGTALAGFKEIRWGLAGPQLPKYLRFIEEHFPQARFIFQTRAWDQVAQSGWWQEHPKDDVQRLVLDNNQHFRSFAEGQDNCLLLDYSEFAEGLDAYEKLANFIGRPFDAEAAAAIKDRRLMHLKHSAESAAEQ